MEEESSDTASNAKRLEELLVQLGTRYDQSLSGLTEEAPVAPSTPISEPISQPFFQPPGTWLNELKSLEASTQTKTNQTLSDQSTPLASTTESHVGLQSGPIVPPPLAYPQIPGALANRVSQSGILNAPAKPASRTTDKLDEKSLLFPTDPKSDSGSPPTTTPKIVRILPDPPRRASGTHKRRSFVPAIVCLVILAIAGVAWLLQQSNARPSREFQQEANSMTTPANTPTLQSTPAQTPTDSHHPTQTPTPKKQATPTPPSQPTAAPTSPPTQVAKPPVGVRALSFEDGGTDGWVHSDPDGTLYSVKNLATNSAKDGSHVLMVSYNSNNSSSYPTLETPLLPKALTSGQTITAYILKTQGSNVEASLYIADQNDTWYKATSDSNVAFVNNNQTWYAFTFKVPSGIQGTATKVGVILFGYNAVVYIDGIDWS